LVRLRRTPAGVVVDTEGRGPGRGAYLHPDQACVDQARKRRALERALRGPVPEELWPALGRIISPVS